MVKITIIVSSGEQFWGMDLEIRWRTWDEFRAFGQGQAAFSSQPGRELDLCMVEITIIVSGEQFWGMDLEIKWRTWDEFRASGQGQAAFSSQTGRELDLCMVKITIIVSFW